MVRRAAIGAPRLGNSAGFGSLAGNVRGFWPAATAVSGLGYLLDEAAQQAAVGGVGGGAAQALAGQHGALVVGGFGQQQVGRLAVGKCLGQLLQLAHFGRTQGVGWSRTCRSVARVTDETGSEVERDE